MTDVPVGDGVNVSITAEGYQDYTGTVDVAEDTDALTFKLTEEPKTVDIAVTVLNVADDSPVEGAIVTIGDVTGSGTGSAGGCTLSGVTVADNVAVIITCEGYTEYSSTVDIAEDTDALTFKLTAS